MDGEKAQAGAQKSTAYRKLSDTTGQPHSSHCHAPIQEDDVHSVTLMN